MKVGLCKRAWEHALGLSPPDVQATQAFGTAVGPVYQFWTRELELWEWLKIAEDKEEDLDL